MVDNFLFFVYDLENEKIDMVSDMVETLSEVR